MRAVPPGRRLLCCLAVDAPGGAEVVAVRLLDELARRGWAVTVAGPRAGTSAAGSVAALAGDRAWPHRVLDPGPLAAGAGRRAALAWPRAAALARAHDAVLVNGTVTARLLPGLAAARRRTVLYVHDVVDHPVPAHWRLASATAAASAAAAAPLVPKLHRVVVAHAAVDPDPPPAPAPWADPGDPRPVVAFIGRIEPRKGVLDLVAAVPAIRAGRPDVRVVIVGDDPYASAPDYLAHVRASRQVEHVGWAENAPGVMRHAAVLVAPSHREPFGTVLSEAMAVGTPVVATAVDGLPEVVTDGVDGALVPPRDPAALAAGVLRVLADRDAMGAAARVAARRFSPAAVADRVEPLLAPR